MHEEKKRTRKFKTETKNIIKIMENNESIPDNICKWWHLTNSFLTIYGEGGFFLHLCVCVFVTTYDSKNFSIQYTQ